jgi:hypothetical protein
MKIKFVTSIHAKRAVYDADDPKKVIRIDKIVLPAGSIVESDSDQSAALSAAGVDRAELQRLIAAGVAEVVDESQATASLPVSSGPSELEQTFVHLTAIDASAFIGFVRDPAILAKLETIENARPNGPRKSVMNSIAARAEVLTPAGDAGQQGGAGTEGGEGGDS